MKANILAAVIAVLLLTAVTAQCPPGNWTFRGDSCYLWISSPQYWFDAEQMCRSHQGHLVSIGSESENTLVARLAQCRSAWLGRFGVFLNGLTSPSNYEWTDGSNAENFHKHKFTELDSVHKTLTRTDGEWWINSLYHERHPFVCEVSSNATARCKHGWKLFNDHCYLMPEFESNFNEANFYCQSKSSQLVSVLSESELSHINQLIFGIGACRNPLDAVWVGLIKLNPCFPDIGGRELCYQWTDFSGKHQAFPKWHTGHPNNADGTVNCVTLTSDGLRSERCFNRFRFVCRSAAGNGTEGGGGSVDGVVAAFDFRKGLDNLAGSSGQYAVRDDFGVPRTAVDGACFNLSSPNFYKLGQLVNYNDSLLNLQQWTLFVRSWLDTSVVYNHHFYFVEMKPRDSEDQALFIRSYMYSFSQPKTNLHTEFITREERQQNGFVSGNRWWGLQNANCRSKWCDLAVAVNNPHGTKFHFNGNICDASGSRYLKAGKLPEELRMHVGNVGFTNVGNARYCIRCLGIAHKQLSRLDLQQAFATYCPP